MAAAATRYYCHKCQKYVDCSNSFECSVCKDTFIEEVETQAPTPRRETIQLHRSTPFGNTTIVIGGGGGGHNAVQTISEDNLDIGTFLQTIMTQLAGGLVGGGGPQIPFFIPHQALGGGHLDATSIDALLTQFLNQMGENSGPAPAPEERINALPTVKITAEQERDNLQCAICMDDFKANDSVKRLPCSHHFHEECVLRWLRLHGTCPTCRVPIDRNSQDYSHNTSNTDTTRSSNNNRRNDGGHPGSNFLMPEFD